MSWVTLFEDVTAFLKNHLRRHPGSFPYLTSISPPPSMVCQNLKKNFLKNLLLKLYYLAGKFSSIIISNISYISSSRDFNILSSFELFSDFREIIL